MSIADERRARLFRFIEAGATEDDFPSFAAALDEYIAAVVADRPTHLVPGDTANGAWWGRRGKKFREDYLTLARKVIAIVRAEPDSHPGSHK